MTKRVALLGALALVCTGLVRAEGVAIDHSAVGCIVAGQYPQMNACFSPVENVARARVYFRAAGGPYWYFVDMKPGIAKGSSSAAVVPASTTSAPANCFMGTLPRPKKSIAKMDYYVEVVDKAFAEARTEEYQPDVVDGAQGCKRNLPVAPFVSKASVAVGAAAGAPAVPVGFAAAGLAGAAGGVSTGLVVAGVAGAGAATAGVVAATNGGGSNTTNTTQTLPNGVGPSPSPIPSPTPSPSPSPVNRTNRPPNAIVTVTPDPASGVAPLKVRFDACSSTDPDGDTLTFQFNFGDGSKDAGSCRSAHTYAATTSSAHAASTFEAQVTVSDGVNPPEARSFPINVGCSTPRVRITSPANNADVNSCSFLVSATASDSTPIERVDFYDNQSESDVLFGTSTAPPYGATFTARFFSSRIRFRAIATNACGGQGDATIQANVRCYSAGKPTASRLSWTSELDVAGARGQVVLNGDSATYPGFGRSMALAVGRPGQNRVDAQIVEASGSSGTWRFEFGTNGAFEPGSLSVTAGDVVDISATAVIFRVNGRAGERVAFNFRTKAIAN